MSDGKLPPRASLEFLKKVAKERLVELRQTEPRAKLSDAQVAVAREQGFPSWRALKAEYDNQRAPALAHFFSACRAGDVETLRPLLTADPSLARAWSVDGRTGLHEAVKHPAVIRLLLHHGAEPDARDAGDNAYALHFAAKGGHLESVRALLDGGADAVGAGDVHRLDVIGWATCFHEYIAEEVLALLLERGARHNIFSAVATGDLMVIQSLTEENPSVLARRMSRFEQALTPLHFAIAPPNGITGRPRRTPQRQAMVELLIELGAELEARDEKGRTPLDIALLQGDTEVARRLVEAGAHAPTAASAESDLASLGGAIRKVRTMLRVPDVRATIEWYTSIGFRLTGEHENDGVLDWASVSFGMIEVMLGAYGESRPRRDASFWYTTDRIDDLYRALKQRQLEAAQASLAGTAAAQPQVEFVEDLYQPFYGGRQFSIRDNNGFGLVFFQPVP